MKLIADTFAKRFSHWKITLPENNLDSRRSGYIKQAGWLIQYCFVNDEKGEYMDYYAAHRMTDDSHVRIYADGNVETLPALSSMCLVSDDPIENNRLEEEYYEYNRKVVLILREKGFDKFTVNMFLHAGLDKETKVE
jgi:hypothetical protein